MRWSSLSEFLQLSLGFLQPVRHPHLAVYRRRRGEVLLRLLALVGAAGERAEAKVTVGNERAHPDLLAQLEGVAIAVSGHLNLGRFVTGGDLGEEPEGP
jgi:hypothetical protein